jgi:hypothetical protein
VTFIKVVLGLVEYPSRVYRHIVHTKVDEKDLCKRLESVSRDEGQELESGCLDSRYFWYTT